MRAKKWGQGFPFCTGLMYMNLLSSRPINGANRKHSNRHGCQKLDLRHFLRLCNLLCSVFYSVGVHTSSSQDSGYFFLPALCKVFQKSLKLKLCLAAVLAALIKLANLGISPCCIFHSSPVIGAFCGQSDIFCFHVFHMNSRVVVWMHGFRSKSHMLSCKRAPLLWKFMLLETYTKPMNTLLPMDVGEWGFFWSKFLLFLIILFYAMCFPLASPRAESITFCWWFSYPKSQCGGVMCFRRFSNTVLH